MEPSICITPQSNSVHDCFTLFNRRSAVRLQEQQRQDQHSLLQPIAHHQSGKVTTSSESPMSTINQEMDHQAKTSPVMPTTPTTTTIPTTMTKSTTTMSMRMGMIDTATHQGKSQFELDGGRLENFLGGDSVAATCRSEEQSSTPPQTPTGNSPSAVQQATMSLMSIDSILNGTTVELLPSSSLWSAPVTSTTPTSTSMTSSSTTPPLSQQRRKEEEEVEDEQQQRPTRQSSSTPPSSSTSVKSPCSSPCPWAPSHNPAAESESYNKIINSHNDQYNRPSHSQYHHHQHDDHHSHRYILLHRHSTHLLPHPHCPFPHCRVGPVMA